jgi:large subunit ribosomal protein L23
VSGPRTADTILVRPVVSEKSYAAMAAGRYVFRCRADANKIEIKKAVEELFADQKIQVVAVNTISVRGKLRLRSRGRTRIEGRSPSWKKAIVTLAEGQSIKGLFEGV